ncbi:hypothetical protein JOB18_027807, partial [Solea senegalensis]
DRFVCGVKSEELCDHMLNATHTKDLTLAGAYEMGLAHEVTKQNAQQWSHKSRHQRQKEKRTQSHVTDALAEDMRQTNAVLRRRNAGHVRRKDTSSRKADQMNQASGRYGQKILGKKSVKRRRERPAPLTDNLRTSLH